MLVWLFTAAGMMLATENSWSHGLYVVPHQTADRVSGVVRYTDQTPATQVAVEILAEADRRPLAAGMTDADGRFDIPIAATGPLIVVAEGEEGHRAEARTASAPLKNVQTKDRASVRAPVQAIDPAMNPAVDLALNHAALQGLREDFARLEHRLRVQDLIGAIGYLVGLIGAWAWWKSRGRR